ncbi:hypothetical protein M422DRAFT_245923 [Sphaerobolus stellatus SS14]|nr:hypothetical protein M422DRAFT_245923 [Sphaerobolus stellatus SS14]
MHAAIHVGMQLAKVASLHMDRRLNPFATVLALRSQQTQPGGVTGVEDIAPGIERFRSAQCDRTECAAGYNGHTLRTLLRADMAHPRTKMAKCDTEGCEECAEGEHDTRSQCRVGSYCRGRAGC